MPPANPEEGSMVSDGGARRFAIGAVIRSGLAITWHNLFRFAGIVFAVGIPVLVLTVLARMLLSTGTRTTGTGSAIDFANNGAAILFLVVASLLAMLAYLLTQAAIVTGTLQVLRGRGAGIGACLSQALSALPRLFPAGMMLFMGGGALAGIFGFFIVQIFGGAPAGAPVQDAKPALAVFSLVMMVIVFTIITLVWVFVPAIVVERAGPIACFKRSLALTKGHRWPIAGIVLMLSVANLLVSALTRGVMANGAPLGGLALNVIAALFFMVLAAVLSAVGYSQLRAEKEGIAPEDLRAFD
jgi:hypothetical protein